MSEWISNDRLAAAIASSGTALDKEEWQSVLHEIQQRREAVRWRDISAEPPLDGSYIQAIGGSVLRLPRNVRVLQDVNGRQTFWWAMAQHHGLTHWRPLPEPPEAS